MKASSQAAACAECKIDHGQNILCPIDRDKEMKGGSIAKTRGISRWCMFGHWTRGDRVQMDMRETG
jgi:hypothetical protein